MNMIHIWKHPLYKDKPIGQNYLGATTRYTRTKSQATSEQVYQPCPDFLKRYLWVVLTVQLPLYLYALCNFFLKKEKKRLHL